MGDYFASGLFSYAKNLFKQANFGPWRCVAFALCHSAPNQGTARLDPSSSETRYKSQDGQNTPAGEPVVNHARSQTAIPDEHG